METNLIFQVLAIAYVLELSVILMDGAWYALVDKFDKKLFISGALREVGFAIGILILAVGSVWLPADVFVVALGGADVSIAQVANICLFAYLTKQVIDFVKSANDLNGLEIEQSDDELKED